MAATFIDFVPGTITPFSFSPTLDGVQYAATVPWNEFAQRHYLGLTDLSGNQILYKGLASSGPRISANFTWANGIGAAELSAPHWVPIGTVAPVRISQTGVFDSSYQALSTSPITLTFPFIAIPGAQLPVPGIVNFALNLLAGVTLSDGTPLAGYLLFHYDTMQFEFG